MPKMRVTQSSKHVGVGKKIRMYCRECTTEYEILHEPDYTDPEFAKQFGGRAKLPGHCPFCGSDKDLEFHA